MVSFGILWYFGVFFGILCYISITDITTAITTIVVCSDLSLTSAANSNDWLVRPPTMADNRI